MKATDDWYFWLSLLLGSAMLLWLWSCRGRCLMLRRWLLGERGDSRGRRLLRTVYRLGCCVHLYLLLRRSWCWMLAHLHHATTASSRRWYLLRSLYDIVVLLHKHTMVARAKLRRWCKVTYVMTAASTSTGSCWWEEQALSLPYLMSLMLKLRICCRSIPEVETRCCLTTQGWCNATCWV